MRRLLPWIVLLAAVLFAAWKLHTTHFDWTLFLRSFRAANPWLILMAVLLVWSNNVVRALRWAVFLEPAWKSVGQPTHDGTAIMDRVRQTPSHPLAPVPWYRLIGSQFIGFSALALFGRIGELVRPLLLARRTGLSFSSQIAVLTVERIFDLAAFGLIFALNLVFSPALQHVPYLHKAGYTIAGLMLVISTFVLLVRVAGDRVARLAEALAGRFSPRAGAAAAARILEFRAGLAVLAGARAFLTVSALSLLLWATIAAAYVLTLHAFPAPLAAMPVSATVVLMGFSVAGSALPVPGGGGAWAGNVFALATIFKVPAELAAGAGLMLWLVTSWSVVPAGLVYARLQRISLRGLIRAEHVAEERL